MGHYHQLIADQVPLDTAVGVGGTWAFLVVHWPMPVWPRWQTATHVADPKIVARTTVFRDRGVEWKLERPVRGAGRKRCAIGVSRRLAVKRR